MIRSQLGMISRLGARNKFDVTLLYLFLFSLLRLRLVNSLLHPLLFHWLEIKDVKIDYWDIS